MTDRRKINIPTHVMFREVGGETVLLNLDSETYFGLDDIGTEILRLMRQGATIDETVEALLPRWDVEPDVLAADVGELLDQLAEHQLIVWQ